MAAQGSRFIATAASALFCLAAQAPTAAQVQQPLTQLQFDIVGVRLVVDPPALTVPKNIATQINTSLALPPNSGPETRDGDRHPDRRRHRRGRAARARPGPDAHRHPCGTAHSDPAPGAAGRLFPRRHPPRQERADDPRCDGSRRPARDDDPHPRHQRSLRHQRDVATAVARRDPRQGHRHRPEQLPRGQLSGRLQHRRRTIHDQPAGGTADARVSAAAAHARGGHPATDGHQSVAADSPDAAAATIRSSGPQLLDRRASLLPRRRRRRGAVARRAPYHGARRHSWEHRVPQPVLLRAPDGDQRGAGRHHTRVARDAGHNRAANRARPGPRHVRATGR